MFYGLFRALKCIGFVLILLAALIVGNVIGVALSQAIISTIVD